MIVKVKLRTAIGEIVHECERTIQEMSAAQIIDYQGDLYAYSHRESTLREIVFVKALPPVKLER